MDHNPNKPRKGWRQSKGWRQKHGYHSHRQRRQRKFKAKKIAKMRFEKAMKDRRGKDWRLEWAEE